MNIVGRHQHEMLALLHHTIIHRSTKSASQVENPIVDVAVETGALFLVIGREIVLDVGINRLNMASLKTSCWHTNGKGLR